MPEDVEVRDFYKSNIQISSAVTELGSDHTEQAAKQSDRTLWSVARLVQDEELLLRGVFGCLELCLYGKATL